MQVGLRGGGTRRRPKFRKLLKRGKHEQLHARQDADSFLLMKVTKELTFTQNVELDLSENPDLSNISPVFHTSLIKPYFPNPIKFTGREKTKLGSVDEKENRYEVERVMEYRSQPGTGLPQYKVRWKGYDYHQDEWVNDKDIDHSLKKDFWLNGNQGTTYRKRLVNKKMWQNGKGKSREETLRMIATERDRILNPPVTSHATIVKPPVRKLFYTDNTLAYDHVKKAYVMH